MYPCQSLWQQRRLFGLVVEFPVDPGDLAAPSDPLQMAQGQDLFPAPVHVIGNKARFLIDLIGRVRLYTPASVKFTGISTSLPQ